MLFYDDSYRNSEIPELYRHDAEVELDLGCGNGRFSEEAAARFPQRTFLAADIMMGRIRKCTNRARRAGHANVIPIRAEARLLVTTFLPDTSLNRIHILCPDPWPKARHRHHRLICSEFIGQIHRVLKDDGEFHFSSDDQPYLETVIRLIETSGLFKRDDSRMAEISDIKTDFELRWLNRDKPVTHCLWVKAPLTFSGAGH